MSRVSVASHRDVHAMPSINGGPTQSHDMLGPAMAVPATEDVATAYEVLLESGALAARVYNEGPDLVYAWPTTGGVYLASGLGYPVGVHQHYTVPIPKNHTHVSIRVVGT